MKTLCNEAVRPEFLFGVSAHASFSVVRKLAVFWEKLAVFLGKPRGLLPHASLCVPLLAVMGGSTNDGLPAPPSAEASLPPYRIIFSMGSTRIPCAPSAFSLPMISQKHF